MPLSSDLTIVADPNWHEQAETLARQLRLRLADELPQTGRALQVGAQGLALVSFGRAAPGPVRVDFVAGALAHRRRFGGGRQQDIARAVGLHKNAALTIADLTAGLGRDAFVLASLGATLTLVERHPVVAALLQDGLQRARLQADEPELEAIMARMTLVNREGREWLASLDEADRPDVIYLDPMFPSRQKAAKVKKEMAVFHDIVGADEDSGELLPWALGKARYRVVVKRPAGAPVLAGHVPALDIRGKSTRYDIYTLQKIPTPNTA